MATVAMGQDAHGFMCEPVVPETGQTVVDFSTKGALASTMWRYRAEGDTALSVVCRGADGAVREEYGVSGDSVWLKSRECRVWVSCDSVATVTRSPKPEHGTVMRKVRRFMSEHYVMRGTYDLTTPKPCRVILAEGDTVNNAQMYRRREVMEVIRTDADYTTVTDSIVALVNKEIWCWEIGGTWPWLARTEITEIHNLLTGEFQSDGCTCVFPRTDNPEIWPITEIVGTNLRHTNSTRGYTEPLNEQEASYGLYPDDNDTSIEFRNGTVRIDSRGHESNVTVTDVSGRVMHSCEASGTVTINTGGWPYGEYIVKAGETVRKIILVP